MVKRYVWFGAALLAQIGILAALPLGRNESGKRIWLSAKVTNLRDVMRGSGIRLKYDIERLEDRRMRGETVYTTLRRQSDSTWSVDTAWADRPSDVSPASILIRGKTARRWEPIHVILRKKSDGTWLADSVAIGQVDTPFRNVESHRAVADCFGPEGLRGPGNRLLRCQGKSAKADHPGNPEASGGLRCARPGRPAGTCVAPGTSGPGTGVQILAHLLIYQNSHG